LKLPCLARVHCPSGNNAKDAFKEIKKTLFEVFALIIEFVRREDKVEL